MNLTKEQKVWFNVEALTTGGIIDHYINNGAAHNKDSIDALELLCFHDIAELMYKVNSLFVNGHPPTDVEKRNEQWDSWCGKNDALLDEVDKMFWERNESLENALMEYIIRTKIGKT